MEMRDRYMHGEGHAYPVDVSPKYIEILKEDVLYVKNTLPVLRNLYEE